MEICEIGRTRQMIETLEIGKEFPFDERIKKIEELFIGNRDCIQDNLINSLKRLTLGKEKGQLVISFLRSSYILNSHELHIAYYEKEPFVEEDPDRVYFSIKLLFQGIEEDLKKIDEKLHKKFIRMLRGETEEIRRWYMKKIYTNLGCILKKVANGGQKTNGIGIYYGEFMGELENIGEI